MIIKDKKIPVLIVVEGWGTSGKGTLISNIIKNIDPRFFKVCNIEQRTAEEKRYPFLKKYFDLKGCYDQIGEVYWTQHCNFQPGDTGYIYGSAPESAIRFSFEILESDMPYDPKMDSDDDFVKSGGESNKDIEKKKLFAHMKLTGETTNRRLSLVNLLDRGLKAAPMGALNLSKPELKDLLIYIHENF